MTINRTIVPARTLVGTVAVAAVIGTLLGPVASARAATGAELFISEYVEGTGTNQAIEIYNPTDVTVNLSASGYSLAFYMDGSTSLGGGAMLSGTLAPAATWVITPTDASGALLAKADQTAGTSADWFDGNDVVVLSHGGTAVDIIGQVGFDPGTGWGSGDTSTADHTLRRKTTVTAGDTNPFDAFDPATEWDGFPVDTFDGLGWFGSPPVSVTPVSVDSLRALVAGMVEDGSLSSARAHLLDQRLDRVDVALAAGRTADARAQLRALDNQAEGLAPRWMTAAAADLLKAQAQLLAQTI
jgi:uncharacterized protein